MSVNNLLFLNYWFSQPYIARGAVMWLWAAIFLGLTFFGLICKIIQQNKISQLDKKLWARFANTFLTTGILGLFWMFMRQERIAFLAWRFWLFPLGLGFVWYFVKAVIYAIKRVPAARQENSQRETLNKYLPKK